MREKAPKQFFSLERHKACIDVFVRLFQKITFGGL